MYFNDRNLCEQHRFFVCVFQILGPSDFLIDINISKFYDVDEEKKLKTLKAIYLNLGLTFCKCRWQETRRWIGGKTAVFSLILALAV